MITSTVKIANMIITINKKIISTTTNMIIQAMIIKGMIIKDMIISMTINMKVTPMDIKSIKAWV